MLEKSECLSKPHSENQYTVPSVSQTETGTSDHIHEVSIWILCIFEV